MRYFVLLVALGLLFDVATAAPLPADTAVLSINRLPAAGMLLAHGWRYHAGDDPAWARPDFDDRAWDTLSPARPRRALPARLSAGIGWLRLRFTVGDSLRQRALLLQAGSNGAWEIYLDGQLLGHDGTLHPNPAQVQPNPNATDPLEVPGTGRAAHVLAVRFAPWQEPALLRRTANESPFFSMRLQSAARLRTATAERAALRTTFVVVGGVVGLLMLLHLAFYYYNPARRANLYFAFYTGALSLGALGIYFGQLLHFSSSVASLAFGLVVYVLLCLSSLWAARALYALFGFRPGKLYAGLCVACGGLLICFALNIGGTGSFAAFLLAIVLATVEQLRLTGRALRQRRGGAAIIGVGFAVTLLAALGFGAVQVSGSTLPPLAVALSFPFIFLPPALAISLFLAREFARDAELLQVKLVEVERLSAQTLAQEQDKQTLLESQNEMLETQVAQRTGELQRSLTELRATQAQLIQREKMASLGELTAGIAHEIQNPLNFVNNFSEVSTELLEELEEEQAKPMRDAGLEAELVGDLRQNMGKISHHGRRAAAIVRGMLEHSRTSTGERAPTDLNQLAEEYLRLAYQGLRAKDKTFNATLETDFAPDLPRVEAAGADVGRVLLNLFGNAFYAVQKRQQSGEAGYKPVVSVRTKRVDNRVEICVSDNGTGIPAEVKAKIFQPFFTTKPTGEGTGLGLSLSYDIITKAHGGTLAVSSTEGQGTKFVVALPA